MFKELRITNFKSWQDTGKIRLAPLTVFFGTNSAGKSSINQFLLMLKQTAQSPDRKRVLHLGDSKTAVELGTFGDLIYKHQKNQNISFEIKWELPTDIKFSDPIHRRDYSGNQISFRAEISQPTQNNSDIFVQEMSYHLINSGKEELAISMRRKGERYELDPTNYQLIRQKGRGWPFPAPVRFYGYPDEVTALHQNAGFVKDLVLALEKRLQDLYYLGPLREYPKRQYMWSGEIPEHVGWRGERSIDAILAARGKKFNFRKKKGTVEFEENIATWFKKAGLIESFIIKPIAEGRKEYEVMVKTIGSEDEVNLTDVGFGVSQVLPVLVSCFYVPANSTIIFEQPEIHLHPAVQSFLADIFISAIQARENNKNRNIQLLIESHSEHFLRRLQRRIAEQVINPEQAALYFCEVGKSGSTMRHLDVDLYGNIGNWPKNFFGDEIEDLAAKTEAGIKRKMQETNL